MRTMRRDVMRLGGRMHESLSLIYSKSNHHCISTIYYLLSAIYKRNVPPVVVSKVRKTSRTNRTARLVFPTPVSPRITSLNRCCSLMVLSDGIANIIGKWNETCGWMGTAVVCLCDVFVVVLVLVQTSMHVRATVHNTLPRSIRRFVLFSNILVLQRVKNRALTICKDTVESCFHGLDKSSLVSRANQILRF